jgi:molybdate transport system substrate-binding protein
MRRLAVVAVLAIVAGATAGGVSARRHAPPLTVFAAASLTDVLPQIDPQERYSFGGSNALAAQIRQGLPADVFASANVTLPDQLYLAGLVERPVLFTANTVVMIARKGNPARLHGVFSLERPGLKIVLGAPGVPVGDYTRTVLARLGLSDIARKAVSQETDVREVLAKVALGEADVGFVYATDARTVKGQVAVFAIPSRAQPKVNYAVAVVRSSRRRAAAEAWVERLRGKAAQATLRRAGFLRPGR